MADPFDPVDAVAQASFLVQGMLERRAAARDVSLIQTRLLGILRDRTPTINELAQLLGLDKSSTSGLVDRAQRRGFVRRVPSQIDRRSVRVRLTHDGRALAERVAGEFSDDINTLLEPLAPADRERLTRLLSDIVISHAQRRGVDLFATTD